MKNYCFSKKLLFADYAILALMIAAFIIFSVTGRDTSNWAIVIGAWIAQIAISSGFYYWKAKAENLLKMSIELLKALPDEWREKADLNQMIEAVFSLKD